MKFTKEEIILIEKLADQASVYTQQHHAKMMESYDKLKKISPKAVANIQSKIFDESVRSYDMLRTISAKCEAMRK